MPIAFQRLLSSFRFLRLFHTSFIGVLLKAFSISINDTSMLLSRRFYDLVLICPFKIHFEILQLAFQFWIVTFSPVFSHNAGCGQSGVWLLCRFHITYYPLLCVWASVFQFPTSLVFSVRSIFCYINHTFLPILNYSFYYAVIKFTYTLQFIMDSN